MTDTVVAHGVAEMRASLLDPCWVVVEVRDTFNQIGMGAPVHRKCAVVADDGEGMCSSHAVKAQTLPPDAGKLR